MSAAEIIVTALWVVGIAGWAMIAGLVVWLVWGWLR